METTSCVKETVLFRSTRALTDMSLCLSPGANRTPFNAHFSNGPLKSINRSISPVPVTLTTDLSPILTGKGPSSSNWRTYFDRMSYGKKPQNIWYKKAQFLIPKRMTKVMKPIQTDNTQRLSKNGFLLVTELLRDFPFRKTIPVFETVLFADDLVHACSVASSMDDYRSNGPHYALSWHRKFIYDLPQSNTRENN